MTNLDPTSPSSPAAVAELLGAAWQAALGAAPAGPEADFFAAGGDSLLAVRMLSRLRQAGLTAAPADILRGRTFGGILSRIEATPAAAGPDAGPGAGPVPLLPAQRRWIANDFTDPGHFSLGWILDVPERTPDGRRVDGDLLESAVVALVRRHEALRTRYLLGDRPSAEVLPDVPPGLFTQVDVPGEKVPAALADGWRTHAPAEGRVLTARWLPAQRLLQIALHHLTLDGLSVELVADDLEALLTGGQPAADPGTPRGHARALADWLASPEAAADLKAWAGQNWSEVRRVPTEHDGPGLLPSMDLVSGRLGAGDTAALQRKAPAGLSLESLVLAAAANTIMDRFGLPAVSVDTYHHGRDRLPGGPGLESGIGYFQANYPVVISAGPGDWPERAAAELGRVPEARFGFDALRFAGHAALADLPGSGIRLNFRSRMNAINAREADWLAPSATSAGGRRSPRQREPYVLMLEADQVGDSFAFAVKYSRDHFTRRTVEDLVHGTLDLLARGAGA
ncbi:Surfactin synthase subunit 2 [Nonomuraea coxensis DSM 45129]|uniref:Surfactin synthase subunit 2 n=1 Tax=Nonomuraea coxensis DSM 45129 TaxID=1122611 RepID=A0ABX8UBY0_9ACTN|nr:condensation domain-containing protein [Nonomuraea coxensis]QYC44234.1 Surfactin synthase subunit 2 [Nonomuraea coxensis DSM 45129]